MPCIFCHVDAMIAASLVSLASGGTLAYLAERVPARVKHMETVAGLLIVVGLALLGSQLPIHR